MFRLVASTLSLAVSFAAVGSACGPGTQTFPLEIEGANAQSAFDAVDACARELGHKPLVSTGAVTIEVDATGRVEFRSVAGKTKDDPPSLSMSTFVATDNDRGALPGLKALGDAVWDCATKGVAPQASASVATSATAAPSTSAVPAPTSTPTAAPTAAPTAPPTATPTSVPSSAPTAAPTASPSSPPTSAPSVSASVPVAPPPPPQP